MMLLEVQSLGGGDDPRNFKLRCLKQGSLRGEVKEIEGCILPAVHHKGVDYHGRRLRHETNAREGGYQELARNSIGDIKRQIRWDAARKAVEGIFIHMRSGVRAYDFEPRVFLYSPQTRR